MVRDSRKIAAILAADVVDYSRLMEADEAGALAALKERRRLFDEQIAEFDGREFGSVGDSLMAEFPSAVNAVSAALAIQERVTKANSGLPPPVRMQLRIGVNLGDVIEEQAGVFGDAVNVAARLQALAKPGGILISGAVYDQVHQRLPARYVAAGMRHVKNITEPVRTFEVSPPAPLGLAGRARSALAKLAARRVVRISTIAAGFVAVAAIGLFWRDIPVPATGTDLGALLGPAVEAPAKSIAVMPFDNMTGDPANDYLGNGLAEELQHRLSRVSALRVAARRSAFAFKGKDIDIREIADALGVNYIVEGSVRREGGRVRVNAALVDRASAANRWSNTYESTGDQIEEQIGAQVLAELKRELGVESESAAPEPPGGGVAAYDFYLRGLFYLRQPRSARTLDAAEELFLRALEEQPDYARAQAGLCEARVERYALDRVPAHVTAAETACDRAQALDSSAQEVHEAMGHLRLATGDAAEAESAFRQALALVPESPDILVGLASALAAGGKTPEAEQTYRRAIAAQSRYWYAHLNLGNFYFNHGRAGEAIEPYRRAAALAPDNPNVFNNLGAAYLHLGDFERAAEAVSRSLDLEPRRGSYSNAGTVHYYRGRYREAADMFRKAINLTPGDHRLWGNLADALFFDARKSDAFAAYRRALELAEGELAINPRHAVNQALAAYYAIQLGDEDRARRGVEIALAEGDRINYVHYYVALAELGLGDRARAIAHARRARELGFPDALLRAAPELHEIRKLI